MPVERTVRDVVGLIRALGVESPTIDGRRLVGLGVAIAGLVDDATNVVVRAPNLGWTDVGLGQALSDQLGFALPVVVANDGDVGALAEVRFGAGVGVDEMLYISGEVGVGGGYSWGVDVWLGDPVSPGRSGTCRSTRTGSRAGVVRSGCWETETGELALLARGGRNSDAGIRALAEMMEAAERGEAGALAAFAEEARWLGVGIAGLINIFDPALVVLGGFFGPILPLIGEQLRSEVEARVFLGAARTVPIVAGDLGADAGLIGAAELALEPLVENPLMVRDVESTAELAPDGTKDS